MTVLDLLRQCEEYFDRFADISDEHNEDGSPRPNEEMTLLRDVREAIKFMEAR